MSNIDIKTYTNVWNADRRIYRFEDVNLPVPISFKQFGLFFAAAILWFPLMYLFQVPFTTSWGFIIIIGPPIGIAVLGNKPIFGGKTIIQALVSEIRYSREPRFFKDSRPCDKSKEHAITSVLGEVWYKDTTFSDMKQKSMSDDDVINKNIDSNMFFQKLAEGKVN